MTHRSLRTASLTTMFLAGLLALASCGGDGGTDGTPPVECEGLAAANAALEAELFTHLEEDAPDPERPSDVDFSAARDLYQAVVDADPSCLDARFGLAVTGLLALSTDPEVNDAFDEWDAYLDARVPFEVEGSALKPMGIPIAPTSSPASLKLPFEVVPLTLLANARTGAAGTDPQLARVQAILEERVLPRVDQALGQLDVVGASSEFTFTVTGRMQGDVEEEPAEIDQTDILALRAGCHLLKAAILVATSYEVNLAAYDSAALHRALLPGSGWLALRDDGEAQMGAAHAEILEAIDDLDLTLTTLLAETDLQDDDVIKIGPDAISRRDIDSIRVNIPNLRAAMSTGYTRVDDWDDDDATPAVALRINAGAIFLDPIEDWKALLPPYTVRLERRGWDESTLYASGQAELSVTIPATSEYDASARLEVDENDESFSFNGEEPFRAPMEQFLRDRLAQAAANPDWGGDYYGYVSFDGPLEAGTQQVTVSWSTDFTIAETFVFIPIIDWQADELDQWIWPDPTLGGLLPDMASTNQLLSTFGIDEEDWERDLRVLELDWAEEGGSSRPTPPVGPPPPGDGRKELGAASAVRF